MNCQPLTIRAILLAAAVTMLACASAALSIPATPPATLSPDRLASIPASAMKVSPSSDEHPPVLHSGEFSDPVPLPGMVNTAGAEDSPFITPDGTTLYFFFTPDLSIPAERQLLDGVTGIYMSTRANGAWGDPARIMLQNPGAVALDGCEFVLGEVMWFCSAREGLDGIHWFTADHVDGAWRNWRLADFDPEYRVGELHMSRDGTELYFGADRPGGKGGMDIWVSTKADGAWQEPVNLEAVNTADGEGWPALRPDGSELWFSRNYSIWRSLKIDGEWQPPEEIVSSLSGEPSIDDAGNLYFVHHFLRGDSIVEADIYVAYRR